jgi:predicted aspartyl protease
MAVMRLSFQLAKVNRSGPAVELHDVPVDRYATWTVLPRSIASRLDLPIHLSAGAANAAGLKVEQSYAEARIGDRTAVISFLVSDTFAPVIGKATLTSLSLQFNASTGELEPFDPLLLKSSRR